MTAADRIFSLALTIFSCTVLGFLFAVPILSFLILDTRLYGAAGAWILAV